MTAKVTRFDEESTGLPLPAVAGPASAATTVDARRLPRARFRVRGFMPADVTKHV
jgi:hypothetical protein